MKLDSFQIEDWLNVHEQEVQYHLSESCANPFSVKGFLDFVGEPDTGILSCDLGYGKNITGSHELKQRIAGLYEDITEDNITVTFGISNANVMAMMEFLKPGQKLLVPMPTYDHFTHFAESMGVQVWPFEFDDRKEFCLESFLNAMELVDAVAIVNPNNPSGFTLTKEEIKAIKIQAKKTGCFLIVDEAYRFMTLDEHSSFAEDSDYIAVTGGLSKAFGLPGLRVGWVISSKKNIDLLNSRRNYHIITLSPMQDMLACIALKHADQLLERTAEIIAENHVILDQWLLDNPSFSISASKGSLHLLHAPVDSASFSEMVYQKYHLLIAPGECFDQKGCWRISLSIDPNVLKAGLEIIKTEFENYPA